MSKTFKSWNRIINPPAPFTITRPEPAPERIIKTKRYVRPKRMTVSVPPDSIKLAHMLAHVWDSTIMELVTLLLDNEWSRLSEEQKAEAEQWYSQQNRGNIVEQT